MFPFNYFSLYFIKMNRKQVCLLVEVLHKEERNELFVNKRKRNKKKFYTKNKRKRNKKFYTKKQGMNYQT